MLIIKNERMKKIIRIVIPLIAIPLIILIGTTVFESKSYYFISLAVTVLSLLLFISGIDDKKTGTRRMVITSVMVALCVAGRFIPLFKPVTALTILTAMYLGSEAGFTTGAMAALLSNFYFGQGPWTPFQMFAWGIIGFISGKISEPLKKSRSFLIIFGTLSGIAYSFIMDIWTVLWYNNDFDMGLYGAAIISALPHTAAYAVSNVLFLHIAAKPVGEKLERIRIKYGI